MVVRYEHMWIAIPLNLIAIMFVLFLMAITKLWMFGAPRSERHIPAYSLHVMKELPPDKPVPKKSFNPYYGMTSAQGKNVYNGRAGLPPKAGAYAPHNAPHKYSGSDRQVYPAASAYPAPAYQQAPPLGAPQPAYNDTGRFFHLPKTK